MQNCIKKKILRHSLSFLFHPAVTNTFIVEENQFLVQVCCIFFLNLTKNILQHS